MLKLSWAISKSSSYFCPLMLLSSQRAYCDLSSVTDPIILYKLSYFLYKLVYHSFAKTSCLFSFTSGICSVSGWLIMTHCSVTLLFYSSLRPLYWVTIYTSPLMKSVRQGGGWGGIENWKAWFFKTFSQLNGKFHYYHYFISLNHPLSIKSHGAKLWAFPFFLKPLLG